MPDLRIKPNIENGDLPEQMELFDGHSVEKLHKVIDRKIKILEDSNKLQDYCKNNLVDIFNPLKMKEVLDKANGRIITPKDKE